MDKQKAGWSDWWHFFQILVNSEWIVIMLSDYSTYLIMSHHLTLIHTLQQLMNSTKLFLQSFNFSFASPEQNRCAIYLRFQKKILIGYLESVKHKNKAISTVRMASAELCSGLLSLVSPKLQQVSAYYLVLVFVSCIRHKGNMELIKGH